MKLNPYAKAQTTRESKDLKDETEITKEIRESREGRETSRPKRKAMSPGAISFQRKTINRGNPIKNVQITHIIESTLPSKFNIKES